MRMGQGVEWGVHALLALSLLDDDDCISAGQFAASFDCAPTYLNKQLQALVRAGLLESQVGVKGGFRLARPANRITLMDVVVAIEGAEDAFRCTEVRRHGPGERLPSRAFEEPCAVHGAMQRAEMAWRRALAQQTIADVSRDAEAHAVGMAAQIRSFYARD